MLKKLAIIIIASMLYAFPILFYFSQTVESQEGNGNVIIDNTELVAEGNNVVDGSIAQISIIDSGGAPASGGDSNDGTEDGSGGDDSGGSDVSGDDSGDSSDNANGGDSGGDSGDTGSDVAGDDSGGDSGGSSDGSSDNSGGDSVDTSSDAAGDNSGGSSSGASSDVSGDNGGSSSGGNGDASGGDSGGNGGGSGGNNGGGSGDGSYGSQYEGVSNNSTRLVVINEIHPETSQNGMIELFNPRNAPVNVNQWYITNSTGYIIVTIQNQEIAPYGFLVVNAAGLTGDNQKIGLFDSGGSNRDYATYTGATSHNGLCYARTPDGSDSWKWTTCTLGASNGQ